MRKLLLYCLLLFSPILSLAQTSFNEAKNEAELWFQQIKFSPSSISGKTKTVNFDLHNYTMIGFISKERFIPDQIVTIYDTKSDPKVLLEGKVSYCENRLVITGVKNDYTDAGITKTYGSFYISNTENDYMTFKRKKDKGLVIREKEVTYYIGYYLACPVVYRVSGEKPFIFVDGETGGQSYSFLSAPVPSPIMSSIDYNNIKKILLGISLNTTVVFPNESQFCGKVKAFTQEDNSVTFQIMEGDLKLSDPKSDWERMTVKKENGTLCLTLFYTLNNNILSNETLYVPDNGTIGENDYWNINKYYENFNMVECSYRNGSTFKGEGKAIIIGSQNNSNPKMSIQVHNGTYRYYNGDVFVGDVSGETNGSFFIDGTTTFKDGGTYKGNWLKEYTLTSDQWKKVKSCTYPSDARNLAKKLCYSNSYKKYTRSNKLNFGITYFNPKKEGGNVFYCANITYDTKYDKYQATSEFPSNDIKIEFRVNKEGKHLEEVIYMRNSVTGILEASFINVLKWYSNGQIESITSYAYPTKKLYLSCNFFSDGTLRSAYQYGIGNSSELTIRKTKESHPTWGGYTSKLYDLNGNYEREIMWNIGEEGYMAPFPLELDELKLVNPLDE